MSRLYLFNYNNYFNRIIKKGVTLSDYGTPIYTLKDTNFFENDGVSATHTVNYNAYDGDYIVITDDKDVIKSRWFVVENKKQRGGQHTLNLRRDLIVDYYNQIITAPALINRAMIKDPTNPLIFNSEGFSFNQIKRNESLLKDLSKSAWYILYFAKNATAQNGTITTGTTDYDTTVSQLIDASVYKAGTYYKRTPRYFQVNAIANYNWTTIGIEPFKLNIQSDGIRTYSFSEYYIGDYIWFDQNKTTCQDELEEAFYGQYNNLVSALNLVTDVSASQETALNRLGNNNSIYVLDSDSKVYKVTVKINRTSYTEKYDISGTLSTAMKNLINTTDLTRTGEWGDKAFEYGYDEIEYIVTTELQTQNTLTWNLFEAGKTTTKDADYNIIAIPYNNIQAWYEKTNIDDPAWHTTNAEDSEKLVRSIIEKYGSTGYLYDVQLIPYLPYPNIATYYGGGTNGRITLHASSETGYIGLDDNQYYNNPENTANIFLMYVESASFTTNITKQISLINYSTDPAINKKVNNECVLYRLCSPNYNGMFEFSPAKNDGVDFFNVDVTLRPYNPYIHINPNFKSLYGNDYNDVRGLICQGDFSLPIVTDQFKQYEYQNKNYLNVFNRQIEHMDFEFSKARTEAMFSQAIGSIGAGISGGVTGGLIGSGLGAGVGALVGGVSSAIGGAVDYSIMKQRQAEAKDLTIDNFKYQLGNIKALAYSINKVTPLTFNNKIFPVLEYYSCTEQERNILLNKIKYNSMNVNAIGTIDEFLHTEKTFICGSIIRLEELNVPTHEANEIYDEIMKGVYI